MSVSRQRAEQKRAVLSAWVSRGVPDGKLSAVPRSLNEARLWNDVDLGVERIGSKSEFTRNHPDVGPVVIEIERLVAILLERTKPARSWSKRKLTWHRLCPNGTCSAKIYFSKSRSRTKPKPPSRIFGGLWSIGNVRSPTFDSR